MSNEPPLCRICDATEDNHEQYAHEFSRDGKLVPKEKKKEPAPKVVVVVDAHLRKILVRKGILTAEDFLE